MATTRSRLCLAAAVVGVAGLAMALPAEAAPRHHARHMAAAGVSFGHGSHRQHDGGYQTLVSDGSGTGFGFHRLPGPYRVGAAVARNRQSDAVRSAVIDDAVESYGSGPFYGGLVGDNGFGAGGYGHRGVLQLSRWLRLALLRRLLRRG